MSRVTNKSLTNHSTTTKSKLEGNGLTVFQAFNKLKFEQDKLLQEHKRYRVLNRQISKETVTVLNRQKQHEFFQTVRQSANLHKETKRYHQSRQIEELKARYTSNMKNRQQHKNMIESVRKSFHQANHELYEQIRQKKQQNQTLVMTQRAKYVQSRVVNRVIANESKDMRRRSIQNFYKSRSNERSQSKSLQIADIIKKSQERHKMYDVMLTKNSRIKENKLKHSRLTSEAKSDRSLEKEKETIANETSN